MLNDVIGVDKRPAQQAVLKVHPDTLYHLTAGLAAVPDFVERTGQFYTLLEGAMLSADPERVGAVIGGRFPISDQLKAEFATSIKREELQEREEED